MVKSTDTATQCFDGKLMKKFLIVIIAQFFVYANVYAIDVGEMAPDFVGRDYNGDDTLLSEYKGQVVVLTFWGGWVFRKGRNPSLSLLEDLYSIEQNLIRGHGKNKIKLIATSNFGPFSDFRRKTKKRKSKVDRARKILINHGASWNMPNHIRISYGLQSENEAFFKAFREIL